MAAFGLNLFWLATVGVMLAPFVIGRHPLGQASLATIKGCLLGGLVLGLFMTAFNFSSETSAGYELGTKLKSASITFAVMTGVMLLMISGPAAVSTIMSYRINLWLFTKRPGIGMFPFMLFAAALATGCVYVLKMVLGLAPELSNFYLVSTPLCACASAFFLLKKWRRSLPVAVSARA